MINMSGKVLALYDFASKQEYIYRTSKIKEVSGASALLAGIYRRFPEILRDAGIVLLYDLSNAFSTEAFENGDHAGEVLYDGGGSLMVLWRTEETYVAANRIISAYLLKNAPGLSLIACHTAYTGQFDDVTVNGEKRKGDRTRLYDENRARKNLFPAYDLPSVMPFTQIDPATFLPVTYKRSKNHPGSVYPAAECSLSADRYAKAAAYEAGEGLDDDARGMFAVIYIDGNAMGVKLMACSAGSYDEGVEKLRSFSKQVNDFYVEQPLKKIRENGFRVRKVIGGGDEITLICEAKDAFRIMRLYFTELERHSIELSDRSFACTSCAGISVFHAKAPFNVAYGIAEAACEKAKEKAHEADGNYFCFYYCHAGVTNTFDRLHGAEQAHASGKPYRTDRLADIDAYAALLNAAGRSNVKALGAAALTSPAHYRFEAERVNAYLPKESPMKFDGSENEMKLVYDMSEFYDLWFATEEKTDE